MATICAAGAGTRIDPEENLGLVWKAALRLRGRRLDMGDMVGEGSVALLNACRRFQEGRAPFGFYATVAIRRRILAAIAEQVPPVAVPRWVTEVIHAGVTPDSPGLTETQRGCIADGLRVLRPDRGGESSVDPDALAEMVVDHRGAEDPAGADESVARLLAALDGLHDLEAEVVRRHYGLGGGEPETLREIGRSIGRSAEGVRLIEAGAMKALRRRLGAPEPPGVSGGRRARRVAVVRSRRIRSGGAP